MGEVDSLASSRDGNLLCISPAPEKLGDPAMVLVYTVSSWRQIASLEADPARVYSLAVSKDGTRLAAGGHTGRVVVWDISALNSHSCSGFTISTVDWTRGCISIRNSTSRPLDLLGWRMSDGDRSFTFEVSAPVAAGETYVACKAV